MQTYQELFSRHDITVAQTLLTKRDLADRLGYLNARNTLLAMLELRVLPVINENDVVASDEIEGAKIGDNDNLSALVANLVDADMLALLTDIGGLYTADPRTDPNAALIPRVDKIDASVEALAGGTQSERSTGGMATKIQAAKLATGGGTDMYIVAGKEPDVITRLAEGEPVGTYFPAAGDRMESRKRWMLAGLSVKGTIFVDEGAAKVLRGGKSSLLPAGVQEVSRRLPARRRRRHQRARRRAHRLRHRQLRLGRDRPHQGRPLRQDRVRPRPPLRLRSGAPGQPGAAVTISAWDSHRYCGTNLSPGHDAESARDRSHGRHCAQLSTAA